MKTEPVERGDAEDIHLCAYNGTFWDLGFKWQWDAGTYRELCHFRNEKEGIRVYVERHHPHLLKAYDADFLVGLIHGNKVQRHAAIAAAAARGQRPDLSCNGVGR